MTFKLHPDLIRDCLEIGDFPLCKILLMNTRLFPWLILVPKREGVSELFDLSPQDYDVCFAEIKYIATELKAHFNARKMNIAALGNKTPQLHIHIIARFENDAAWPNPVWGTPSTAYSDNESSALIDRIRSALKI